MGWGTDALRDDLESQGATTEQLAQFDLDTASFIGSLTGQDQANASTNAAAIQAEAGQDAIAVYQAALEQQRADLQPFTDFGLGFIPQANDAYNQSANLFAPNALDSVLTSDTLEQLNNPVQERLLRIQAGGGRTRTDETAQALQSNRLNLAQGLLGQQQNAALANRNSILQALGIGQNSAAGQGAATANTAANVGNTITGIGAVNAGGIVGAANAQQQGVGNIISLGTGLMSGGFNPFSAGTNPYNMQNFAPSSPTNYAAGF